jgi:hypothetical protein
VFPAEYPLVISPLDNRGNPLPHRSIKVTRSEKSIQEESNQSSVTLSVPPGEYYVQVFNDEEVIGARNVALFGERDVEILTKEEPLFPLIATIVFIILLIGLIGYGVWKRQVMPLLVFVVLLLSLSALVSPWWQLSGSTQEVETTTTLYLFPSNLVTHTETSVVHTGELASLPDIFLILLLFIPLVTIVGGGFLFLSVMVRKNSPRICVLFQFLEVILLLGVLMLFGVGMSLLAEAGVGSFLGEGLVDISIPGESMTEMVHCTWGPTVGFYQYMIAFLFLVVTLMNRVYQYRKKEQD